MTVKDRDIVDFQRTFDSLAAAMHGGRLRSAREAGAGLTAAQVDLLTPLAELPEGLPVSRIADAAGVAGPTATRMLGGLRDRSLVEHHRDFRDARVVNVRLTGAGHAALTSHLEVLRARQRAVYDALDPDERRQLVSAVQRMTELIRAT